MTCLMDVKADAAQARRGLDRALGWLEEKPLVVILTAAAATVGTSIVLASFAGWPHVLHVVYRGHSWEWLLVCLVSEVVAYAGYVLTVRDMARVDGGEDMSIGRSTQAVVGGFGVFAATRGSGGFAVDYWAFRRVGPPGARPWPGCWALDSSSTSSSRSPPSRPPRRCTSASTGMPATA